jgi:hypothetical protein
MSIENFQVERIGSTVRIWIDSGADVERNMVAFSHKFSTEIEADLIRQNIDGFIENERLEYYQSGINSAQKALSKQAEIAVNELINNAPF